jgi:hypothetical protein
MNKKTARLLIFSGVGLICLLVGMMVSDRTGSRPRITLPSASAAAQRMLAEARASADVRESAPPSYRTILATGSVRSEGAIMLVKNKDLEGVAQDPQNIMDTLTEMSGANKYKPSPVRLTDSDLRKKVLLTEPEKSRPLSYAAVLRPGESAAQRYTGGKSMITAPVDFQLFKSPETWKAFADSHAGRFPAADFSREQMLILVSVSELPSGIFKVAGVKKTAREAIVSYRVDPLAMSAETGAKEKDFYSAAAVPKNLTVRLEQIP